MKKVCIFNNSNDVSRFDTDEKLLKCINFEIFLTCCTEAGAV